MKKQILEYTSPVDALIALVKQLNVYEAEYRMESAEFFTKYSQGEIGDDEVFVEWSGNYQHFLAIRQELETKLQHVA